MGTWWETPALGESELNSLLHNNCFIKGTRMSCHVPGNSPTSLSRACCRTLEASVAQGAEISQPSLHLNILSLLYYIQRSLNLSFG